MKVHTESGLYSARYLTKAVIEEIALRDYEDELLSQEQYDRIVSSAPKMANEWLRRKSTQELISALRNFVKDNDCELTKMFTKQEYGMHHGWYFHKMIVYQFLQSVYKPFAARVSLFLAEQDDKTKHQHNEENLVALLPIHPMRPIN